MAETVKLWRRGVAPSGNLNLPRADRLPVPQETQFFNTAADVAFDWADKFKQQEYYAQLNTAQAETLNRINQHFLALQKNSNPQTYEKLFEDTIKNTKTELTKQITNSQAAERYSQWLETSAAAWRGHNGQLAQQVSQRNMRDGYKLSLSKYVNTIGNAASPELRQQAIAQMHKDSSQMIESNIISEADAEMDFNHVLTEADKIFKDNNKKALNQYITDMAAADGWDKTLVFLNDPKNFKQIADKYGIDSADYDKVFGDIKTQAGFKAGQAQHQLELQRETDRKSLYNAINQGTVKYDDIRKSSLDGKEQQDLWDYAQQKAKDIIEGKEPKTDKIALWDIKEKILQLKQGEITENDVRSFIKTNFNKLSAQDLDEVQGKLHDALSNKTNTNLTSLSLEKWGQDKIKEIHKDSGYGKEGTPEAQVVLDRRLKQWEEFWHNKPESTQAEAEEFLGLLTKENVKSYVRNWITGVTDFERATQYDKEINAYMGRIQPTDIMKSLLAGGEDETLISPTPNKTTSPFPDYPDAYQENGNWYVIKDGKRYRIQE